MNHWHLRALLGLLLFGSASARGAEAPQPTALPPAIAAPRDVAYPGEIRLTIDATDVARHIFRGRESIPVAGPGPLTLLFPRWIPGAHSPVGSLEQFVGLVITAGGQRVEWKRDEVEVAAFHVTVPAGVTQLDLEFQFASPTRSREGRIVMTPEMLNLQWESILGEVRWEGPAFKSGLIPGTQLIAVNGYTYDADGLKDAVKAAAKPGAAPIELLVKNGDRYRTVAVAYHDGLRYPHLERLPEVPDLLDAILTARK